MSDSITNRKSPAFIAAQILALSFVRSTIRAAYLSTDNLTQDQAINLFTPERIVAWCNSTLSTADKVAIVNSNFKIGEYEYLIMLNGLIKHGKPENGGRHLIETVMINWFAVDLIDLDYEVWMAYLRLVDENPVRDNLSIKGEAEMAWAKGDLLSDNPYPVKDDKHHLWRRYMLAALKRETLSSEGAARIGQ